MSGFPRYNVYKDLQSHDEAEKPTAVARPTDSSSSEWEGLCARCAQIDLDKAFKWHYKDVNGKFVAELGTVATWNTELCIFCKLLASLLPSKELASEPSKELVAKTFHLRSYSTKGYLQAQLRTVDTFLLKIPKFSACLVLQPPDKEIVRQLQRDLIDYEILRGWMKYCHDHHTRTCVLEETIAVQYLKLVDCRTRKVILANNQPYVTLSYVWGNDLSDHRYYDTLPIDLPMTIEDSIKVVIALGYQYIWIDRYCIDQSKPEEVQHQVGMMDLIYRNSDLTIIAAAGENPTYGLPGVSKRARQTQHAGKIKNEVLISTMDEPAALILNSKWSSRAWTYQEFLLSRRRLVFTDQQTYFECYGMYCCETLNLPLDELHVKSRECFQTQYCSWGAIGMFPRGVGEQNWAVLDRIEEYSKRSLAKDSDILNGFMGVLRVFSQQGLRHVFGIPCVPQSGYKFSSASWQESSSSSSLDNSRLAVGFVFGLLWQPKAQTTRRLGFPSWSWIGWHGPVEWVQKLSYHPTISIKSRTIYSNVSIQLRSFDSESWCDITTAFKSQTSTDIAITSTIRIKTTMSPINLIYGEHYNAASCHINLRSRDGGYVEWQFWRTGLEDLYAKECVALFLAHTPTVSLHGKLAIMVVRKAGEKWERVGFNWMETENCKYFNSMGICEHRRRALPARDWEKIKFSLQCPTEGLGWYELI